MCFCRAGIRTPVSDKHSAVRCEMKRLYVKPEARGTHLGDALVNEIINRARQSGYKEMVLDTIMPLKTAIGLYKKHGFAECEPYYDNTMNDVIYNEEKPSSLDAQPYDKFCTIAPRAISP